MWKMMFYSQSTEIKMDRGEFHFTQFFFISISMYLYFCLYQHHTFQIQHSYLAGFERSKLIQSGLLNKLCLLIVFYSFKLIKTSWRRDVKMDILIRNNSYRHCGPRFSSGNAWMHAMCLFSAQIIFMKNKQSYNLGLCFFSLFDSKDIFDHWNPFYLLGLLRSHWFSVIYWMVYRLLWSMVDHIKSIYLYV